MSSRRSILLLATALTVITAACGGGSNDPSSGGSGSDGGIFISGSSTVEPISATNADKFGQENSDVAIRVEGPGTGDGFEIFCAGESDISDASRPIKAEEVDKCEAAGIEFVELKIAIDGLSVITSPKNDKIECLSFNDLYALLGPESTGFDSWSDANKLAGELKADPKAAEFGQVHAPYPDVPLVVTAPGEESGTFDSFVELALEDLAELREQDDAAPRPDYQASPNDNVITDGISGSDTSLGWVGYAFVQENAGKVKPLAVDGGQGCVEPNPETIASGEFPIARDLYIYVNKAKAEENPAVGEFIDFYLSDAGIATVEEVGYVGLSPEALAETRSAWETKRTGAVDGGK